MMRKATGVVIKSIAQFREHKTAAGENLDIHRTQLL